MSNRVRVPRVRVFHCGHTGGVYVVVDGKQVNDRWLVATDAEANECVLGLRDDDDIQAACQQLVEEAIALVEASMQRDQDQLVAAEVNKRMREAGRVPSVGPTEGKVPYLVPPALARERRAAKRQSQH